MKQGENDQSGAEQDQIDQKDKTERQIAARAGPFQTDR